ncbi:MAG: hypothetical protein ACXVPN_10405 [Bacteroidia bacterium]
MKTIKTGTLFFLAVMIFSISCKKNPLVKDISGSTINVLAPANNFTTPSNSITFWWDLLSGADKYNIQIVKPSFSSVQSLIVDTFVTTNKFTYALDPGTYQWRVRGENNNWKTPYVTRTLTIDTTSNLAYITVVLTSPADSVYSNLFAQSFAWSPISVASSYLFVIPSVSTVSLTATSTTHTFAAEGTYTWEVRAENSFSISQYSSRTIIIDTTRPLPPTLTSPANLGTLHSGDSLKWSRNAGTGKLGAYNEVLYVASSTDSLFNSPILSLAMSNTVTAYKVDTASGVGFVKGSSYFWKLISKDRASNSSNLSSQRKFKIN